jgi:hypothetical protein
MYIKLTCLIIVLVFSLAMKSPEKNKNIVEKTTISNLLKKAKSFNSKQVIVEGVIDDVCPMKGCWVQLKSSNGEKIRVKVKDGEIVFPQDSVGKKCRVQGKFIGVELDRNETIQFKRHLAEEKGQKFDPKTVKGPMMHYQIYGTAVKIFNN